MKEPMSIGDIMTEMAMNPNDEYGQLLRKCPFMQEKLKGCEQPFMNDLIDGQDVMQLLHISPRTLQTLRSNGTVPYTRIGHKIYYLRRDIERILRNNYVMFNIRERYGEDD